ncbi:GSCOCG00012107001-RA-CDS, partial [Cotesia congregata]
ENKSDIWDGEIYKNLSSPNQFLSNRNNISFTWNTDGIDLYKSSKFSIWPFYLVINELSFSLRSQLKNVLIAGFWFGPTKPKANVFMNSFRQRIENIYSGIFVRIPNHPNAIKVRGMIICGTCDLPAKTCFLNMKGHNGIYGCCKCKIKSQKEGKTRVFPYEEQMNPRATEETVQQGERAFETGESVEGVKGPTTLSKIVLDFIDTTSIDSMHCVFLGIVKQLMRLWLDSKFHKSTFSL